MTWNRFCTHILPPKIECTLAPWPQIKNFARPIQDKHMQDQKSYDFWWILNAKKFYGHASFGKLCTVGWLAIRIIAHWHATLCLFVSRKISCTQCFQASNHNSFPFLKKHHVVICVILAFTEIIFKISPLVTVCLSENWLIHKSITKMEMELQQLS